MLTIDLNAIQQNWLKLSLLTQANVAGVIKANAYGLGAKEVARSLFLAGCREFFLATIDEAIEARSYLPSNSQVYLLGGVRNVDLFELHNLNITPVLCSSYDIEQWLIFRRKSESTKSAALKINTGMTRFGVDEKEFFSLCGSSETLRLLNLSLLMSHLSCADEATNMQNIKQLDRFHRAIHSIKNLLPSIRASLSNSSGIFLGAQWHFDLVRPGAALYGVNPTPAEKNPMLPVLKLELPILQVRTLSVDELIGYAASEYLCSGSRVAVVAGGYADGVHRTLGACRDGFVLGRLVKVVGRISMDSMIFDVSHLPHSDDEIMQASVELVGVNRPLDALMKCSQSLGYEVLTSLGNRYKRKYLPGIL